MKRILSRGAVAVLLVATAACTTGEGSRTERSSSSSSAPEASPSTYLGLRVEPADQVDSFDGLAFSGFPLVDLKHGRLWSGSTTSLGWINPHTGAAHVVDDVPGVYLAVYGDSLYRTAWAHDNVARYAISGKAHEVARHRAPSPLNITAGPDGVWASDHDHGYLLRLDPRTMRVVDRIKIGAGEGLGPAGLERQGKNLWVNVKRDVSLALVDGRTGRVKRSVQLEGDDIGDDLALTSPGLWAFVFRDDDSDEWQLVDTRSLQVKATVRPGDVTSATPVEVDGEIWLPVEDKLVHLDPAADWQPDRVVDLGMPDVHPRFATVGFGSVWISSLDPARIVRVDASNLR